ncbi:MarR family transcriptional regulator, negative regulator of the multidrug operon emrRAB [Rhodanobacter glycinis]|uniref:MarR family transcriptional regulator, negative regulator of the multidrug operon emrRAB n=2 Tax=Rhodanobacteraceae TaxID=1775411 RepID=A0A1I3XYU9_9GAMM|nr:MarR family transcriptional regulator [Rhodanobacter sp. 115]SFK24744.1 MarR family transcriptional regulator, negative regulator of the multidrug operon emrRAB [Rhodanobacter glycinis]
MIGLGNCIEMMDEGIDRVNQVIPQLPRDEAKLCRLLLMVGTGLEEDLEFQLKPHKLNHSEFLTLMILYSRPDGSSTPGELCEFASQGATNMTRIGNALSKRGLIVRGASAEDRRRVAIRITAAGRRFVQKVLPPLFPRLDTMFDGFSTTDKRNFSHLLRKLAHNLDQLHADPAP